MKKNIEKTLYILINFAVIVSFLAFVYFNFDRVIDYFCFIMQKTYTTKLVLLSAFLFVCAYISGFCMCLLLKAKTDELCSAYQKRHENISVEKDENKAKIAALEAKIQTLEAALDSALRDK